MTLLFSSLAAQEYCIYVYHIFSVEKTAANYCRSLPLSLYLLLFWDLTTNERQVYFNHRHAAETSRKLTKTNNIDVLLSKTG